MFNVTEFVIALIGVLSSVIALYVIPYIKAGVNAEKWNQLQKIVFVAVSAAEQLGITEIIKNKFDYAQEQIKKELAKIKIGFDDDSIKVAIEAAVRQNFPNK